MIIKGQKLQALLDKRGMTHEDFAIKLGVDESEVAKMFKGEEISYETARKFVYYFKAGRAQHLIDWNKLGIKNSLAKDYVYGFDKVVKEDK